MTFNTYLVADICTGYLEESDLELLSNFWCPTRIGETDLGQGTFHWVPNDDEWFDEDMREARSFGLSERFVSIMKHLRVANIPYVRFDADGGEIEEVGIPPRGSATAKLTAIGGSRKQ